MSLPINGTETPVPLTGQRWLCPVNGDRPGLLGILYRAKADGGQTWRNMVSGVRVMMGTIPWHRFK